MHGLEHQVEAAVKADGQETAENLLNSIRMDAGFAAKAKPIDIENESQAVADLFDLKTPGKYNDKITAGSERLSSDLKRMTGDMQKYNKFLQKVADKIPAEPAVTPWLETMNWNEKTGTWDNVVVRSGDNFDAYRIVQPGNTLSQIAFDTFRDFTDLAKVFDNGEQVKKEIGSNYKDYMNRLVEINKIEDPNKIYVGQAIRLRESFSWHH